MLTVRSHPAVVVGGVSSPGAGVGVGVGVEVDVGVGVGLGVAVGVGVGVGVGLGVAVAVAVGVEVELGAEATVATGESGPSTLPGAAAVLAGCAVGTAGDGAVLLLEPVAVPVLAAWGVTTAGVVGTGVTGAPHAPTVSAPAMITMTSHLPLRDIGSEPPSLPHGGAPTWCVVMLDLFSTKQNSLPLLFPPPFPGDVPTGCSSHTTDEHPARLHRDASGRRARSSVASGG